MPEIRFHVLRTDGVERLRQAPQLRAAAFRLDVVGHAVVERHQADPIAIGLRDPCEHQRRVDRVIELVQLAGRRGHQAAAVDSDHDLLSALGLHLHDHRTVTPSGGRPAHAPDVVAADVVAQAREGGRGAGRAGASHAGHRAETAAQRQLHALDGDDVGKDRHLVWLLQPHLPAPPTIVARHAQVNRAEPVRASLR